MGDSAGHGPGAKAGGLRADMHSMTPTPLSSVRTARPRTILAVAALLAVGIAVVSGIGAIDIGGAAAALTHARPELLVAAMGLYLLSQTASGLMWGVCQGAGDVRIAMPTTLGLHWIARASCELLPAGLGEALRVAAVRRHPDGARAGTWRIAGALTGSKVIDGVVTAVVVLVIALATPLPGAAAGLRWTALAGVGAFAVAGVAWRLGRGRLPVRLAPARMRRVSARLAEGAGVLSDPAGARLAGLLALLSVLLRIACLAVLLGALGIAPQAAPLAFAAIVLAGVVPGAPGGVGAREVVLLPALALAHGVPGADALAFSMAVQAIALTTSLVAGGVALLWLGPSLARGRRAAGEPVPDLEQVPAVAVATRA